MRSKRKVIGVLAHVDSGKTTLAEALLHKAGVVKSLGRVDHRDAYLDTFELEKTRGITIFAKQAQLSFDKLELTLMDTPGHVDFSSEMERTLRVLDYAILIVSAPTGVSGHTLTLWKLLKKYSIPTIIFVNKMDQQGMVQKEIDIKLCEKLDSNCISFDEPKEELFYEKLAMTSEVAMEMYLDTGSVSEQKIIEGVELREIFPVYYGSALHVQGIDQLIDGLRSYTKDKVYGEEFGATVFKITRDEYGNRISHLKLTGGSFKVRDVIKKYNESGGLVWEEKINQIRLYSGDSFVVVSEVHAGMVCAVTGLSYTQVGDGLGTMLDMGMPSLEPVMGYQLIFKQELNVHQMYQQLKIYQEEEPSLAFEINPRSKSIQAKVMGQVQVEVLQVLMKERFDIDVEFADEVIIFKETIKEKVIGIGHFEPLKHYAEVHLQLEPLERGSGVVIENTCSSEKFLKNWQNLCITHLKEITHTGVRIGAELTDVKITLLAGAGHEKHTEGGDFREATYRALKQALMQDEGLVLEPIYIFEIEIPVEYVGRVMSDLTLMNGEFEPPIIKDETAVIKGVGPVRTLAKYPRELVSFTKGYGRCNLQNGGYKDCMDSDRIMEESIYNIYEEGIFTPDSIFCKQGAGFNVPWDKVASYAHVENGIIREKEIYEGIEYKERDCTEELWIDQEEIDEIIGRANSNSGKKKIPYKRKPKHTITVASGEYRYNPSKKKEEYLLVDGYNIIFAWQELKELAKHNLESATGKLLDILSNYQGVRKNNILVVFDAYKVKGHEENTKQYHNISVVYTKERETADGYIERNTHRLAKEYDVVVATSDVVEQLIVMGQGARKISAKQLAQELEFIQSNIRQEYLEVQKEEKMHTIGDLIAKNTGIKVQEE